MCQLVCLCHTTGQGSLPTELFWVWVWWQQRVWSRAVLGGGSSFEGSTWKWDPFIPLPITPPIGIWHGIVLGRWARSDAICWHVLSFHKLPIPLRPPENNNRRHGRAANSSASTDALPNSLKREMKNKSGSNTQTFTDIHLGFYIRANMLLKNLQLNTALTFAEIL